LRRNYFVNAQAKGPLSDHEYVEVRERARRLAGTEGIDTALAKDHLDVLVAPTMGAAWTTDWVNGYHFLGRRRLQRTGRRRLPPHNSTHGPGTRIACWSVAGGNGLERV
jgi:hypothetical protein